MAFFYFLLIFLAFLLVITLLSSIIKFSLLLTTRHSYETTLLIVPSILNMISWSVLSFFWTKAIFKVTGKDISTIIFDNILNISTLRETIISVLPITIIFIVFGIILQSFSFFALNIPYTKICNKIKITFNKVFKIKLKINETEKALVINPEEEELNMVNSFIASFFTFSLTLFVLLICLAIGNVISSKILTSLLAPKSSL